MEHLIISASEMKMFGTRNYFGDSDRLGNTHKTHLNGGL